MIRGDTKADAYISEKAKKLVGVMIPKTASLEKSVAVQFIASFTKKKPFNALKEKSTVCALEQQIICPPESH